MFFVKTFFAVTFFSEYTFNKYFVLAKANYFASH